MIVHQARPLTAAVEKALQDAGLTVRNGEKPTAGGWTGAGYVPYVVVYSMLGGTLDGSLEDPDADASAVYQITSTGGSPEQAEWAGDKVRAALLAGSLAVAGRKVVRVRTDVLGGVVRDDDADPPIYYVPERYRIMTTPA